MSAITGIFYRNGRKVDPELIKKMNNRLSHRGPDGSAIWCEGSVALGHQMLWTTPESLHEKLPFEDDDSGLVITADARIDNRDELSKELDIEDKEDVSDSYFILKAYQMWGENCPDKLLGDFAFAIWDKNEEKLFCARDHMGVKPFYYYLNEDMFVFGTEIKALFCVPGVPRELNELMVAFHLIPTFEERSLTFYGEILRLPAANSLMITQFNLKMKNYWKLDPNLKVKIDSDEDYVNKFNELFNEAVKCRLRSSFPLGFELSGGLDSSSITSVARKLINEKQIMTFSLITKDFPQGDESYYIKKMIDFGGIKPHFLKVDQISPLTDFSKISWHLEQPSSSPNTALFWNLYKKMHNENIRIFFTGYDGDSVLSHGQNYLKELLIKFQWKKLIYEINGISEKKGKNQANVFLNKVIYPLVPLYIKKLLRSRKQGDFILNNKEINIRLNLKEKYKVYDKSLINPNTANEFHYFLIIQGLHQDSFEMYDRLAAAFFIEPRHPFFDKRLIEFCFAIPTEQKFASGWDRIILRRSMDNMLPKEIQWRSNKKFLTSVFERNLIKFEKDLLEKLIYKNYAIINSYVDKEDIYEIYERYKNRSNDYQISDAWDIWKLTTLMLWIQMEKIRRA